MLALAAGTIGLLGPASAVRNLAGLTGLGLLGVAVAGNAFGWLLPTLMAAASIVGGSSGRPDGTVYAWAWVLRPNGDVPAVSIALLLLTTGLVATLVAQSRARTKATDDL